MSGNNVFLIGRHSHTIVEQVRLSFILVGPKTRTYHGWVWSGARRGGGAGLGRTGRRQNSSPRRQASLLPSKASETRRLKVSPEERTSEILCKPMEEHNDRLTSGLRPVYVRFITRTKSALCSWLLTSGPSPLCLCKPFSYKACPRKFKYPKPGHTTGRSGQGGARRGGGEGRGVAGRDADELVCRGNNCPSCSPEDRRQLFRTTFRKNEQRKSLLNRWGNKTRS